MGDVSAHGVDFSMCSSCDLMEPDTFYATAQSSTGWYDCSTDGTDDLWGCGCQGPNPIRCRVLTNVIGLEDCYAWGAWSAPNGSNEYYTIQKASGNGGVMCCKQSEYMPPAATAAIELAATTAEPTSTLC